MYSTIDKVFGACLLGGFGLSVLMLLSAGVLSRFRVPRVHGRVGLRLPRFVPRVRLPRLRLPRPHPLRVQARLHPRLAAKVAARGEAAGELTAGVDASLFPPGTVPVFVGLFATIFGGLGLLAHRELHLWEPLSVLAAVVGGLVVTVLVAWGLWAYFLSGAEASELRGGSPIGNLGHVSLAIPEGGVGTVAYVAEGKRATMPARSSDGAALLLKTPVLIVDVVRHTAVVEPAAEAELAGAGLIGRT